MTSSAPAQFDPRTLRRAGAVIVLFLALGAFAGCSDLSPDPDRDPRVQLEQAQERWEQAGYSTYEYRLEWECQCIAESQQPIWIVVKDGELMFFTALNAKQKQYFLYAKDAMEKHRKDTIAPSAA